MKIYVAVYYVSEYDEDGWWLEMTADTKEELQEWVSKQKEPDKYGIAEVDMLSSSSG